MLEILGVLFTLISVWLSRKQNIFAWPTGIIGTACYYFIFKSTHSTANMGLQIVFIIQGIYGWLNWGMKDNQKVRASHGITNALYICMILFIGLFYYGFLILFNCDTSLLDISTTSLSLFAMVLMGHKKIETWIYWATADVLYIIYFALMGSAHLLSIGLFILLFLHAVYAFFEWKRELNLAK